MILQRFRHFRHCMCSRVYETVARPSVVCPVDRQQQRHRRSAATARRSVANAGSVIVLRWQSRDKAERTWWIMFVELHWWRRHYFRRDTSNLTIDSGATKTRCLQLLEILDISWNLKLLLEIVEISWNLVDAPVKFYTKQCWWHNDECWSELIATCSFVDITHFTCILILYGLSHKNLLDLSPGNWLGWICRHCERVGEISGDFAVLGQWQFWFSVRFWFSLFFCFYFFI